MCEPEAHTEKQTTVSDNSNLSLGALMLQKHGYENSEHRHIMPSLLVVTFKDVSVCGSGTEREAI